MVDKRKSLGSAFGFEAETYPEGWKFRIVETGKSFVADKTENEDPYKIVKEVNGVIVDTYDLARLEKMCARIEEKFGSE